MYGDPCLSVKDPTPRCSVTLTIYVPARRVCRVVRFDPIRLRAILRVGRKTREAKSKKSPSRLVNPRWPGIPLKRFCSKKKKKNSGNAINRRPPPRYVFGARSVLWKLLRARAITWPVNRFSQNVLLRSELTNRVKTRRNRRNIAAICAFGTNTERRYVDREHRRNLWFVTYL